MFKAIEVKPLDHYRISLKYDNGVAGVADLSHLAGKGVFSLWNDYSLFRQVYIDPGSGAIAWNNEIDLCPDSLYLNITKQKPEEVFPILNKIQNMPEISRF